MAPSSASFMYGVGDICKRDDLDEFKSLVAQQESVGWTALLHSATDADASNIAAYCLENRADVDGRVIATIASGKAVNVYRKLLECHKVRINQDQEIPGGDALYIAVDRNNRELVDFCLVRGADPNVSNRFNQDTLLAKAAADSTVGIVKLLLDHGAFRFESGALMFAAGKGRKDMVDLLLKEGFDVNETEVSFGWQKYVGTPLHKAIETGHTEVAEMLLGTDMTLKDRKGRTPIQLAEENGMQTLVEKMRQS